MVFDADVNATRVERRFSLNGDFCRLSDGFLEWLTRVEDDLAFSGVNRAVGAVSTR